jgi:hypothetical protein
MFVPTFKSSERPEILGFERIIRRTRMNGNSLEEPRLARKLGGFEGESLVSFLEVPAKSRA